MGQIVGTSAKVKRCNLSAIQTGGSQANVVLANGEYMLVCSDNSMTSSGNGKFDSYVVGDGTKICAALTIHSLNEGEIEGYYVEANYTNGGYLYFDNGEVRTSTRWSYGTDYIPYTIDKGDITFSAGVADSNAALIGYNDSKQKVNGWKCSSIGRTVTPTDSSLRYVRLSFRTQDRDNAYVRFGGYEWKPVDMKIEDTLIALYGQDMSWTHGGITSGTGEMTTAIQRLHNTNPLPMNTKSITVSAGYLIGIYFWKDGVYQGYWNGNEISQTSISGADNFPWLSGTISLERFAEYEYDTYIVLRNASGTTITITEAEATNVVLYLGVYDLIKYTNNSKNNTFLSAVVDTICPQSVQFVLHGANDSYVSEGIIRNSRSLFNLALEKGFKMVEADIRLTSDSIMVCAHDDNIKGLAYTSTGDAITSNVYISQSTYNDLLSYSFGNNSHLGDTILKLEELLLFVVAHNLMLQIDFKSTQNATNGQSLYNMIAKYGAFDNVIISNNFYSIIKNIDTEHRLSYQVTPSSFTIAQVDALISADIFSIGKYIYLSCTATNSQMPSGAEEVIQYANSLGFITKGAVINNAALALDWFAAGCKILVSDNLDNTQIQKILL